MREVPWSRVRSTAALVATVLGWLIVAVLATVVLARAVAWDRWRWFADLDAATEVLFLPAWLVLVGAAVGRRRWLAAAAACICAAQVVYVVPEVLASNPLPAAVRSEPTVRLFDANVSKDESMAGYEKQIRSYRPQILTMEETYPTNWDDLKSSGALDSLPYQFNYQSWGSRGFIIASHYPLSHVKVSDIDGQAYLVRCSLRLPTGTIPLWVVHTDAPVNPDWNLWNEQLDGVDKQLGSSHPRPLLMVGDFNASWGNRGFRAILSTGLTDAAAARGQPFAFTWSQVFPVLPPVVRIDHVLTGGDLTVTTIGTHAGPGSQHRDITATVAIGGATTHG